MKTFEQIKILVYLKHHLGCSYKIIVTKEDYIESFITSLNADVDYIRLGNDVILRTDIKRVEIKYA